MDIGGVSCLRTVLARPLSMSKMRRTLAVCEQTGLRIQYLRTKLAARGIRYSRYQARLGAGTGLLFHQCVFDIHFISFHVTAVCSLQFSVCSFRFGVWGLEFGVWIFLSKAAGRAGEA